MNHADLRAARDTAIVIVLMTLATAFGLWIAWMTDFEPHPLRLTRFIAGLLLGGFLVQLVIFAALVFAYRADHYARRPHSPLHMPLIYSFGSFAVYFGLASISAIDVFYRPAETWPALRDPGFRLIATGLVVVLVGSRAWVLVELLRGRGWGWAQVGALCVAGVGITAMVIWMALVL